MNQVTKKTSQIPHRMKGQVERVGGTPNTIAVKVHRIAWNKRLRKQIRKSKRFLVHDESGAATEGETVTIEQCSPISKRKYYRLVKDSSTKPEEKS